MKKTVVVLIAVAGVFAVLVTILIALGNMRHNRIEQEPPLTLQELDRIVQAAPPSEVALAVERADAPPLRLERSATEEQRRKMFIHTLSRKDRLMAVLGTGPLGAVADAVDVIAGRPSGESYARACCNLILGDWNQARLYFTDFLRSTDEDDYKQRVCGYMAWLEDDPELAARYAEAACSGEDWHGALLIVELGVATGNTRLAECAMERGRSAMSEFDVTKYVVLDATRQWLSERQEKGREPE